MKHTKGPWLSFSDGSKAWVKSDNRLVATMSCDTDRCDADAMLIASAPAMLEELETIERLTTDTMILAGVRLAIKKAKGE